MAEAGFKIGGVVYPAPSRIRLIDFTLIEDLTGLDSDDFARRQDRVRKLREEGENVADVSVVLGLVGVAVWQANPRWKRDRVVEFMADVDFDGLESFGGDDGPPAREANEENRSPEPSNECTTTPGLSPGEDLG